MVSVPAPPSRVSAPPVVLKSVNVETVNVSLPAPPDALSMPAPGLMASAPAPPVITSLPAPPVSVSAPPLPVRVSAAAPPTRESPKPPPRAVIASVAALLEASTESLSPPVSVVGCISRSEPSIVKAVPVKPELIVTVAVIIIPLPPPSSVAVSAILTVSIFVTLTSRVAVVLSPAASRVLSSSISTIIWSVPAPPLIVSNTVKFSVAKNLNVSSPVPPNTERLPAALAVTFNDVDSESPVAVEALIVDEAPG